MSNNPAQAKKSFLDRFISAIEKGANKLPSPFTLFVSLFIITAIIALIMTMTGVALEHPATGEMVTPNNFFSQDGLYWLLSNLIKNFTGFAPLGLVLVMTLGIGLCEEVGLVSALLRKSMSNVPPALVPYVVAFVGIIGNLASDSASVVIPPIAAMLFLSVGKNPIAGVICGYAGTNAGFSANLFIAGTDSLLQGITNSVLDGFLGVGVYNVEVVCNWFFMIVSTFVLSVVFGLVSTRIVEPRLGEYKGNAAKEAAGITSEEGKALGKAGLAFLVYAAIIAWGLISGVLLNQETGSILSSPFLSGLIPILFGMFMTCGIAYGISIGYIKSEKDIPKALTKRIATMASFIVFAFASSQFIALFSWTKLGTIIAIAGANGLEAAGLTGMPLFVLFILLVTTINLLMSSGSAKWTILAPIFVPMFLLLGYDPAYTQLAYRIGDSSTNILSPMSAYLFMSLSIVNEKYDKDCKLGTLIGNLFPHSMGALIVWIILFIGWTMLNLPIGPGAGVYAPAEVLALVQG